MQNLHESVSHELKSMGIINEAGRTGGPTTALSPKTFGRRGLKGYMEDPDTIAQRGDRSAENRKRQEEVRRQEREARERTSNAPIPLDADKQQILDIIQSMGDRAAKVNLANGITVRPSDISPEIIDKVRSVEHKLKSGGGYVGRIDIDVNNMSDEKMRQLRLKAAIIRDVDADIPETDDAELLYDDLPERRRVPRRINTLVGKFTETVEKLNNDVHPDDRRSKAFLRDAMQLIRKYTTE